MQRRVYFDHDSADGELLTDLRLRECDCLTSREAGMDRATDDQQLAFAAVERRIIITANQCDFTRLLWKFIALGRHHAGIIVANQGIPVKERMRRLRILLGETSNDELVDRIVYLSSQFRLDGDL